MCRRFESAVSPGSWRGASGCRADWKVGDTADKNVCGTNRLEFFQIDAAAGSFEAGFASDLSEAGVDGTAGSGGLHLAVNILNGDAATAGLSDDVAFMLLNFDRTTRGLDGGFTFTVR